MRWAVYARYSDDMQNPKSIDDQVSEARAVISAKGGKVVAIYSDAARSGAHTAQRPEYQRMFRAMREGVFDAIIAEDTDRLARSLKEMAALYDEAQHNEIELWTTAEGQIASSMQVAFKGLMGQDFLRNLGVKTRRGLIGVMKRGGIPGGRCYGYDVAGTAKRTINEHEASIVRRIYAEYVAGKSPLAIVKDLNKEGIKSPRGGIWSVSTVIGSAKRRNGVLNNAIYRGDLYYNRQGFRKDPMTGRRVSRRNDEGKWLKEHHPELIIIDEETWNAAQKRRAQANAAGAHISHGRRPKTLLSGLIKCRLCGKPMAKFGDYFRCTGAARTGICSNNRGTSVHDLEKITIEAVRATLQDPILIARFGEVFRREVNKRLAERDIERKDASRRLAQVETKIANLTRSLETGLDSSSVRARLVELETERDILAGAAKPAAKVKRLIPEPHVLAARQAANENLAKDLRGTDLPSMQLREAFRGAIAEIRTGPDEKGRIAVDVDGNMSGILHMAGCTDDLDNVGCGNRI